MEGEESGVFPAPIFPISPDILSWGKRLFIY